MRILIRHMMIINLRERFGLVKLKKQDADLLRRNTEEIQTSSRGRQRLSGTGMSARESAKRESDAIKIDETGDDIIEQDDLLLGNAQLPAIGRQQMLVMTKERVLLPGAEVEDVAAPRRAGQQPS